MRTAILMAGMTALFLGAGFMIGGEVGLLIALAVAIGINVFAYWNSDKMVLSMYRAQPVGPDAALYRIVQGLATRADMPKPRVFVIDNPQPNAFATGRNPENAAVAATTGLLNLLSEQEVAGVMAHELAHVRNRDTLIMTITATLAGALSMLADFGLFFGNNRNNPLGIVGVILVAVLAPLAAMLVQMAISRTREFEADRIGAEICGHPLWLAAALEKLESGATRIDNRTAEDNPATAHLFIVNPLHARRLDSLFSTHPAIANRVAKLRRMAPDSTSRRTPAMPETPVSKRRGHGSVPHSPRRKGPWR